MLLSVGLLLFATVHGGLNPSVKTMSSLQNTASTTSSTPALNGIDQRAAAPPHTLDTPRAFPTLADHKTWEARREQIRRQVLVSCGLYPLPPKTPLKPKICGRVERDGYTIEKSLFPNLSRLLSGGKFVQARKGCRVFGVRCWEKSKFYPR